MDKKTNFACVFRKKVLPLCPNFESTSETMSGQSQETQLIVSVEDTSKLREIRRAISMLKGVGRVSLPRRKRYSAYELSLRDLDEGRVNEYASVEDFFKKMEVNVSD